MRVEIILFIVIICIVLILLFVKNRNKRDASVVEKFGDNKETADRFVKCLETGLTKDCDEFEDIFNIVKDCSPDQSNIVSGYDDNDETYFDKLRNRFNIKMDKEHGTIGEGYEPTHNTLVKRHVSDSLEKERRMREEREEKRKREALRKQREMMKKRDEEKRRERTRREREGREREKREMYNKDNTERSRDKKRNEMLNKRQKEREENNKQQENKYIDESKDHDSSTGASSTSSGVSEYKTKDGKSLSGILGNVMKKLTNSNIGILFLDFLKTLTGSDVAKAIAKSVECDAKTALENLIPEKGTCTFDIGSGDNTCYWNSKTLLFNNNIRCQCDANSLKWFDGLAKYEEAYAKDLAENNNCQIESGFNGHQTVYTDPDTKKTYKFSENIAISGPYSSTIGDQILSSLEAVNGWASEGRGKYATTDNSSNYTAMNWKGNTKVGCGSAYCAADKKYITVCGYTNDDGKPANTYANSDDKDKIINENVKCSNPLFIGL